MSERFYVVHLIDGTYELFRHFYGLRRFNKGKDRPYGAVVGGDAEVRVAVLDHLEHGLQHADDRAVRSVLAFGKPAQAVEVTEEFVRAVNKMNYHTGSD